MTAEEFVTKFHKVVNDVAEWEMREDTEGDYEHRGIGAYLSLKFAASEHPEIQITDLREVLDELREGESHPVCELIYSQPVEEVIEELQEPAPKKKSKKGKAGKKPKARKTKVAKITKLKLTPLTEMSPEEFEKLVEEKGEKGVFQMYTGEIKEYAEWIWREQDGEEYDLDQCIEMAQRELMDGSWGPREEV